MDLGCYNFDCCKRLDDLVEAVEAAASAASQILVFVVGCFGIDCYYFLGFDSDNFP